MRGIKPRLLGHPTRRLVSASTNLSRLADRDERSASLSTPSPLTVGHYVHNKAFCLSHPPFLTIFQINMKLATPSFFMRAMKETNCLLHPSLLILLFKFWWNRWTHFPFWKQWTPYNKHENAIWHGSLVSLVFLEEEPAPKSRLHGMHAMYSNA